MFRRLFNVWTGALREALACLGLGLRDTRHDGLWWRSALCCFAAVLLWCWLYYAYPGFFLRVSRDVAVLGAGGLLGLGVIDLGPRFADSAHGVTSNVTLPGVGNFLSSLLSIAQLLLAFLAFAAFVYALVFVIGAMATAMLPGRRLLLPRAAAAAGRRYPGWQAPRLPAARPFGVRDVVALLALLIPVWSAAVIVRLMLTWHVRFMYAPAADGVLDPGQRRALWTAQRPAVFLLGVLLCVLMLVPLLNLLVPALACSAVCHLQRRGWTAALASAAART